MPQFPPSNYSSQPKSWSNNPDDQSSLANRGAPGNLVPGSHSRPGNQPGPFQGKPLPPSQSVLAMHSPHYLRDLAEEISKRSKGDLEKLSTTHERPEVREAAAKELELRKIQVPEVLKKHFIAAMRQELAQKVQMKMLENGRDWGLDSPVPSMRNLSHTNLMSLVSQLFKQRPMQQYEIDFLDKFFETKFFVTHATNANIQKQDQSVSLYSRQKLLKENIGFNVLNSHSADIGAMASGDHVFFSLECGDSPQKPFSRFGGTLLRFPIDLPSLQQTATLSLVDPFGGTPPSAENRFETLNGFPDKSETIIENLDCRELSARESIFHGKQMLAGLGMSIIAVCRENMPDEVSAKLLQKETINQLVNGLFRPQILMPRHFFAQLHDAKKIVYKPDELAWSDSE